MPPWSRRRPPCTSSDGKCVACAPTQSPGGCRDDLAKMLGIPVENVTVNVPLLGGGFGRKSKWDYVLEAALVSKAIGAPVKVTWTREDDIQHDFYHTVSVERIDAGVDANGKVIAWRHRSVAPTICSTFKAGADHEAPFELGMGLIDNPFDIPEPALRERRMARRIRASAGSARSPTFRTASRCSRWWRKSRGARTRSEGCAAGADRTGSHRRSAQVARGRQLLELRRSVRDLSDRHRAGCAGWRRSPRSRPAGASRCRRARASASPRIAAS